MADEIRIDDLAAPVLNDVQRLGLDYGESRRPTLTVDAVCDGSDRATGLDDFGPDDFHERLGFSSARWTPTTTGPASAGS